jgi:PAS domain S-box-containing protein
MEELRSRPWRPPDHTKENSTLVALVTALADSPHTILQTLVDKVLEVLRADSAGLSLLTKDEKRFYWAAIAGAWRPHIGGGTPRDFGPCGDVLDHNVPMLFTHWERRYPYLSTAVPLAEEGLLVPFYVNGKAVGTIWAIAHNNRRQFDAEDLRLLESIGRFASAAYQTVESIENLKLQIAAREEAEIALRELANGLEAKVRRLVDSNIIGIFIWSLDGRITDANEAFLRIVGYSRDDLVSSRLRWTELTPPEWLDRDMQQWIPELKTTGSLQPFEKEYFRKDGSRVPVLIGVASFKQSGSQGVAFVLDLTERKRAENLTARFFESAPDGVCIVERDYRYRRANPVYARRWGMSAERIVGMHVAELLGVDRFERTLKPNLDRCFAGEEVKFEWISESRGQFYLSSTYSPLRSGSGEVEAALVIQRDLTEYMRASEALRTAQAELAHANRVATMGQLTASIAHEVNQPIAATLTNAQAALRCLTRPVPELGEVREALASIVNDAVRAGDVVSRIRDLMKKAPPRKDLLDVNGVVREVIELTHGEAVKNGVSLLTELADSMPLIPGDRIQLQQVMLNLIINAVEAMSGVGNGARELLISTGKTASGDVLVAVRDSGPGLALAALERVFDPFYTSKPGGLGMGLSICRSIIEAHGGRLWASANVTRGATFQFTVPA